MQGITDSMALINEDPARATDLLVQLAPPLRATADRRRLRRQLDQLIRANFAKPLNQLNFARFLADLLQIANRAGLRHRLARIEQLESIPAAAGERVALARQLFAGPTPAEATD